MFCSLGFHNLHFPRCTHNDKVPYWTFAFRCTLSPRMHRNSWCDYSSWQFFRSRCWGEHPLPTMPRSPVGQLYNVVPLKNENILKYVYSVPKRWMISIQTNRLAYGLPQNISWDGLFRDSYQETRSNPQHNGVAQQNSANKIDPDLQALPLLQRLGMGDKVSYPV